MNIKEACSERENRPPADIRHQFGCSLKPANQPALRIHCLRFPPYGTNADDLSLHIANDPGLFQREVAPQPELNGCSSVKRPTSCLAG